jgi:hypothetical protein
VAPPAPEVDLSGDHPVDEGVRVRLDPVAAEGDPLRDEDPGTGLGVVLAEQAAWHGDREVGDLREQTEADLRLHLPLPAVAPCTWTPDPQAVRAFVADGSTEWRAANRG